MNIKKTPTEEQLMWCRVTLLVEKSNTRIRIQPESSTHQTHGTGNYYDGGEAGTDQNYTFAGAYFKENTGQGDNASSGGKSSSEESWMRSVNTGVGAFGVGWGAKQELFDFAVRDRAGLTRQAFKQLSKAEQEAAELAALGTTGAKYLKGVKMIGLVGFVASAGLTTYSAVKYYQNGGTGYGVAAKATLDVVMGAIAFAGPIGFAVSSAYFLIDMAIDYSKN